MKTLGNVKSSGFGFAVVAAGQRNMTADPQVIATSTEGCFRITGPVTRILGIQHGDYVMFINNVANIDQAIANKVEELVAFVEENGLTWGTPEAAIAIHKEFDMWAIARVSKSLTARVFPFLVKSVLLKAIVFVLLRLVSMRC